MAYWVHGHSGPRYRIVERGASQAHWETQNYKGVTPYKGDKFLKFFSCGTNVYSCFASDVTAREASD